MQIARDIVEGHVTWPDVDKAAPLYLLEPFELINAKGSSLGFQEIHAQLQAAIVLMRKVMNENKLCCFYTRLSEVHMLLNQLSYDSVIEGV